MSILNAKLRIIAICTETAAEHAWDADGVPYFFYTQERFPYFTIRTGPATHTYDASNTIRDDRDFTVRLVIAHMTEGYRGEYEGLVDDFLGWIVPEFDTHNGRFLVGDEYDEFPDYLDVEGVQITNDTGLNAFQNAGIDATQIGCEFTIYVPFRRVITD